ncbi:biotin--[acetyl-CoA-carboxylase] ligase [Helicobacter bizzozeronii]|uniref:biotin--[acetyl-CoA-carboxylase] ligase n=1 Tax=Helicobacter bizzozeronii TaxID=56877 RepID=UPI00024E6226|nr:biotin--[acetyl-CoA-carboxylase] ligase [Helicobacter bizzozeronii]CCF80245.1 Biotin-protein ligase [Helicobacter bizzozeronii CCUG 35545]
MRLCYFKTLPSTQLYLLEQIKDGALDLPICVVARHQSAGIGSRHQVWESVEKALTFSFAYPLGDLSPDVPPQSWSVYFGFLFKESLANERVWLKWPNDLYKGKAKIGGLMTQICQNTLVCGIGLNLQASQHGALGEIDSTEVLRHFFAMLESKPSWQSVLEPYSLEFKANHCDLYFKQGDQRIFFKDARLLEDGGLLIKGKKYYGYR